MKKTYINPELTVIKMKMNQHLLDGSPNGVNDQLGTGDPLGHELDDDLDF